MMQYATIRWRHLIESEVRVNMYIKQTQNPKAYQTYRQTNNTNKSKR